MKAFTTICLSIHALLRAGVVATLPFCLVWLIHNVYLSILDMKDKEKRESSRLLKDPDVIMGLVSVWLQLFCMIAKEYDKRIMTMMIEKCL